MTKVCSCCKIEKSTSEFGRRRSRPGGFHSSCRACEAERIRVRRQQRKADGLCVRCGGVNTTGLVLCDSCAAKCRATQRKSMAKIRLLALTAYGGKCACCGEDRIEFLAIDHIDGGGRIHRKEINMDITFWLKKHNYPPGFQVLCHNCNLAKGFYGACPHITECEVDWDAPLCGVAV